MALVTVLAPATSANLGPGFDALALALDLHNRVTARPAERTEVVVQGEGAGQLADGPDNLIYRAIARVFAARQLDPPPLRLECDNRIPLARGLGSSAAATAAGLLIGRALLSLTPRGGDRARGRQGEEATGGRGDAAMGGQGSAGLGLEDLLAMGTAMEGHPDNVAACLFGGMQACVALDGGGVARCAVPLPSGLRAVVLVPAFAMDTHAARQLLPQTIPLKTAVHNLGRTALLVAAMASNQLDLLRVATEDAIHQPPRQALFPALPGIIAAALEAGALGAFLSGAGSSVLALVRQGEAAVAEAMARSARDQGVEGRVLAVGLSSSGAVVRVEG